MAESNTSPPAKTPAFKKDWTKGPILRNLLHLSWPIVSMETLFVISQVADMFWVGKLGSSAIAGVGIANIIFMLVLAMDLGLVTGIRALIARYIGAGDYSGANRVTGQTLIFGAVWGLLIAIFGFLLANPIIRLFNLEAAVANEGLVYLRTTFIGWAAMDIMMMGMYAMQAAGDAINPMKIEASARVIQFVLCPILVLGLLGLSPMGVKGAALSNIISQCLGACLVLWILFSGRTRLKVSVKHLRIAPDIMLKIIKIGLPALLMNIQRSLGNLILTWFIAPFGTTAIAAHSLVSRIEMFLFMPGMGLGLGAGVLVGQNLGANQPERAEKSAWLATYIVEAFMLVCSIIILIIPRQIIGVFTPDANLIEVGSIFLRIATAGYLVLGLSTIMQNCIAGAGDTLPNMLISIATIWIIEIPLAYFLSKVGGLEVYGIRWAIVAAMVVGAVVYTGYFKMGKWKYKKV